MQMNIRKESFYMDTNTLKNRIRTEVRSFFEEVGKADERAYLGLLTLYVGLFVYLKIAWNTNIEKTMDAIRYGILGFVMWGSAAYLFFIIASWRDLWKKNVPLIFTGAVIIALTALFSRRMSTNLYGVVMDVFFCLMAYKKNYRKMLRCIFGAAAVMLLIAGLGIAAGFTMDIKKPLNVSPGHSLGILYPNTWGYIAFLVMLLIWYLYLRRKWILTFLLFWSVSVFMYFYISCRTITGFSLVFPFCAVLTDWLEERSRNAGKQNKVIRWLVTLIPFISFAVMMTLSMNYLWVHKHFYPTKLLNFAMRFVQGGLYFKTYGLPLVGNPYRSNQITYINVNDSFERVGILDSSFAAYIIMRGMIWMFCTLLWLCLALWKAMKKKDYAIPLLEIFILLFAMMERPGLEMWYNFVMLYPLAKAAQESGIIKTEESETVKAEESETIQAEESETIQAAETEEGPDRTAEESEPYSPEPVE